MENVIFLETDPAFMLAYRAYGELGPRLNHRGTQTAELPRLMSSSSETSSKTSTDEKFSFGKKYDFGRRVSLASRISMCVATRLPLRNWVGRNDQDNITPKVKLQFGGHDFGLDVQHLPLDDFIARFDQMFPHHLIQEKLKKQKNFPLTKRIMIFRLENSIVVDIIEMIITINIVDVKNLGNMNCSIITTAVNSLLVEGEDGPWYRHLQSICFQPHVQDVHLPCVEEHEHADDDDDDSDSDSDSDDTD